MKPDFNTPPLPLGSLTLHPRHHRAALWWLGWIYRNPNSFLISWLRLGLWSAIRAAFAIILHALPWAIIIGASLEILFSFAGLTHGEWAELALSNRLIAAFEEVTGYLVSEFCIGLFFGLLWLLSSLRELFRLSSTDRTFSFGRVIYILIAPVIGMFLFFMAAVGIGNTIEAIEESGIWYVMICAQIVGLAWRVILGALDIKPGVFSFALLLIVSALMGVTLLDRNGFFFWLVVLNVWIAFLRLYYFPVHAVFWCLRSYPACFRYHPAMWDWMCLLPFPGLNRLLVAYSELQLGAAELEIKRLIEDIPSQRMQALRALTILRAREAAKTPALSQLTEALKGLPEGEKGFLAETRRVRELAEVIVRQQLRVNTTTRPYFREIEVRNLLAQIRDFGNSIRGMNEPLFTEFGNAADCWLKLAENQVEKGTEATRPELALQVFRAGDPVARTEEAFVPRLRVMEELEGQVMLGSGCPGILLRGPRRMGKSSLLKNVGGFLPREVGVAFVSLQSAKLFTSLSHLVGGLSDAIGEVLSSSPSFAEGRKRVEGSRPSDLPEFARFLDECNAALESAGRRVMLALDEYEMLDEKLREGVFTKDLLATIRESIQSHRRIIWAFCGNADITELTGADWTSYLISVRTLEVPVFSPEETHLLLTEPLKHSVLGEEDKAKSALFWKEFWGEDGIARIHAESGGWPYFVQLIAETAVTLANESGQTVRSLPPALLEQALDASVERGRNAFHQLLRSQCREGSGEWSYLERFGQQETQAPPSDAETRRLLKRRQLLKEIPGGGWRLTVPLMARWIRMEG